MTTATVVARNITSTQSVPEQEVSAYTDSLPRQYGFEPLRIEGKIPEDLHGTLYRNGPGLLDLFGKAYDHFFEGDGAVSAVRFEGGKAFGAVKVVQSEGLKLEQRAGKALFGNHVSWPKRFWNQHKYGGKNTANTNVITWQGRLFALMEGGKPTELSPEDLATIGETDLDGLLPGTFSAHPHEVPGRQALYNFGLRYGRFTYLDLFELPFKGKPRRVASVQLPFPPMLHDFMVTENYFVFFLAPIKVRVMRALLSIGSFPDFFKWDADEGTEVILIPIDDPEKVVRFKTDAFHQWHFCNGVERNGELHIDLVHYKDFSSFEELQKDPGAEFSRDPEKWGTFHRMVIDPKTKSFQKEQLWSGSCEFPRIHPDLLTKDYQYVWMVNEPGEDERGREPHSLIRLDVKSGQAVTFHLGRQNPSEPIFVPRKDSKSEADGHVLSLIYDPDSHTSHIGIFDGLKLEAGPVAKVWFDHHIPITFHGTWHQA